MGYRFILLVLILALNAFFAAAEVALVAVRPSRLRALAKHKYPGAQAALSLIANPERLLSVTQVGVTLASLALGWAGEGTLFVLFTWLLGLLNVTIPDIWLHGIGFTLAFLVMSYFHVVIGEVIPKNLAIERADKLSALLAPPLLVFYRISAPFVYVIERSSLVLSRLLGISSNPMGGGHSAEELKYIIQSSRREGHLEQFEQDAIQRLIDLSEYSAREVMVPRHNIVSLPVDATLDKVLSIMNQHKYTRIPVYEGRPEHIIGILHYKDLARVWEERRFAHEKRHATRTFRLQKFLRKPFFVPETKPLNQLVDEFRTSHTHMALVVDEFGTIVGLVTLEDVLEQVFGEIGDEHDVKRPEVQPGEKGLGLDGSTTIRDLEMVYGIILPAEAGFETLAGFLLAQFGRIPVAGNSVDYGIHRFTITEMDRNRIAKVFVEQLTPMEETASEPQRTEQAS